MEYIVTAVWLLLGLVIGLLLGKDIRQAGKIDNKLVILSLLVVLLLAILSSCLKEHPPIGVQAVLWSFASVLVGIAISNSYAAIASDVDQK